MTVYVNAVAAADVPVGTPLAKVVKSTGELMLWPGGVGTGPTITMSVRDWEQLKQSADAAIRVVRTNDWSAYLATEGNGDGL
jgi:ribose 5-phosphate isomerase